MLNIACVDNEVSVIHTMKEFLSAYAGKENKQFNIFPFQDTWTFLESKIKFDIVFLDIDMPGMNGMDTAKEFRNKDERCLIIFVTNWAQYALNGYEVNAFDYYIKPVTYAQFYLKVQRAVKVAEREKSDEIIISENYAKRRISVRDIYFVETTKHKLLFHTSEGLIESWGSMKDMFCQLNSYGFALASSGFLVNLQYVEKMKGSSVWVKPNTEIRISRNYHKTFLDALTEF